MMQTCMEKLAIPGGAYPAFIGSLTTVKMIRPDQKYAAPNNIINSLRTLGSLASWVEKLHMSKVSVLIRTLIQEMEPYLPPELRQIPLHKWCGTILSGNICHRLKTRQESRMSGPNFLSTLLTHMKFDTSSALHTAYMLW